MKISKFFLSFGGLGFLPFMPGTWGSLGGIFLALFLSPVWKYFVISGLFIFATIMIHVLIAQGKIQEDDPSWIVIDEVVGQMITLSFLDISFSSVIIAFMSFRFFDIVKPWPIGYVESYLALRKSTWAFGIMLDDVLAGFAATFFTYCCLRLI